MRIAEQANTRVGQARMPVQAARTPANRAATGDRAKLLALQRTAGNRAVAGLMRTRAGAAAVVQREKLDAAKVDAGVKAGVEAVGLKNKTALALAIYNELRKAHAPTVKESNQLAALKKALTAAKAIDADDIVAVDAAIEALFTAGPSKGQQVAAGQLAKLEIEKPKFEHYLHHILIGDLDANKLPTGYHSTVGRSTTHEAYGKRTTTANKGCYMQSVKTKGDAPKAKASQSTFFPDDMTRDDILTAITSQYGLKNTTVRHPEKYSGMSLTTRSASTIFPVGKELGPDPLPGK